MWSTAYVTTTSFGNLCLSIHVPMTSKLLVIVLIGIMLLRMWQLLLGFAKISPMKVMTTFYLLSFVIVRLFMPKVCQSFDLHDGFIDSPNL